jgi:hypothetical protein
METERNEVQLPKTPAKLILRFFWLSVTKRCLQSLDFSQEGGVHITSILQDFKSPVKLITTALGIMCDALHNEALQHSLLNRIPKTIRLKKYPKQ